MSLCLSRTDAFRADRTQVTGFRRITGGNSAIQHGWGRRPLGGHYDGAELTVIGRRLVYELLSGQVCNRLGLVERLLVGCLIN
jgi:hypothetical protein